MKKSTKINVLGTTWKVIWEDSPKDNGELFKEGERNDTLGVTLTGKRTIIIDNTLEEDIKKSVFYHELVHAVLSITGISNMLQETIEEAVCDAIGTFLAQYINK